MLKLITVLVLISSLLAKHYLVKTKGKTYLILITFLSNPKYCLLLIPFSQMEKRRIMMSSKLMVTIYQFIINIAKIYSYLKLRILLKSTKYHVFCDLTLDIIGFLTGLLLKVNFGQHFPEVF